MGTTKRRQFDRPFKLQVLREIEAGKPVAQAAREHQVHPNTISAWRELRRQYGSEAFAGNGNTPIPMKPRSPNWNGSSGSKPWKFRC